MNLVMRKWAFAYAKTKTQISCAVTAQLISTFVFAMRIVQSLYYLNPKFQASSHLVWLYSPVCVGPGRKPRRLVFLQRGSNDLGSKQQKGRVVTLWRTGSAVAQWYSVRLQSERSGVRNLPLPCCVFEQDTFLPESTGNTQEAVADWDIKPQINKQTKHCWDTGLSGVTQLGFSHGLTNISFLSDNQIWLNFAENLSDSQLEHCKPV